MQSPDANLVNKHSKPSVTLLVSQPLMSPYVAAAVVGSLHHALTAVPMLAFVMGVVVGFGVGTAVIVGPGVLVGAGVGAGVGKAVVGAGVIVGTAVIVGAGLAVGCDVGLPKSATKLDAEHAVEQGASSPSS